MRVGGSFCSKTILSKILGVCEGKTATIGTDFFRCLYNLLFAVLQNVDVPSGSYSDNDAEKWEISHWEIFIHKFLPNF